jgi:hypothetical protein
MRARSGKDDPQGELRRELEIVRNRMEALGSQKRRLADGSWYWEAEDSQRAGHYHRVVRKSQEAAELAIAPF